MEFLKVSAILAKLSPGLIRYSMLPYPTLLENSLFKFNSPKKFLISLDFLQEIDKIDANLIIITAIITIIMLN